MPLFRSDTNYAMKSLYLQKVQYVSLVFHVRYSEISEIFRNRARKPQLRIFCRRRQRKNGEGSLPNQDRQHQTQLDSRQASSRGKLRPRHKDREISSNRSAQLGSRQDYFHLCQSMGNRGVLQECQAANGYGGSHCQERTRRDNIVVPGVPD